MVGLRLKRIKYGDTSGEASRVQRSAYSTPKVLAAGARLKNSRYISEHTRDAASSTEPCRGLVYR